MHISVIKNVQCITSGNAPACLFNYCFDAIQRQIIIYASIVLLCQLSIVLLHLVEAYHILHTRTNAKTFDHLHTYHLYLHAYIIAKHFSSWRRGTWLHVLVDTNPLFLNWKNLMSQSAALSFRGSQLVHMHNMHSFKS